MKGVALTGGLGVGLVALGAIALPLRSGVGANADNSAHGRRDAGLRNVYESECARLELPD
jgi:hypothetical protein